MLTEAIELGLWASPSSDELECLLENLTEGLKDIPQLKLYPSLDIMSSVHCQIGNSGFIEDPEYCMVRRSSDLTSTADKRLVYETTLFVGGCVLPGDDVLIGVDRRLEQEDPPVLILDWNKPVPDRWVAVGVLSSFLRSLGDLSHRGGRPPVRK